VTVEAPSAVLILAETPIDEAGLREFAHWAATLATTWRQPVIPCPLDGVPDGLLHGVRAALATGAEHVTAAPLLLSAVRLREERVAEQFRTLGLRFPAVTFHIARSFDRAETARALTETTRELLAESKVRGEPVATVILGHGGNPNRRANLAGLTRWVFEAGDGGPVEFAFGVGAVPDLPAVLRQQAKLGIRAVVLAAGDWFAAEAANHWAAAAEPVARDLGIRLGVAAPFWRLSSVAASLRERVEFARKDLSLVPKVWDEVARELPTAAEEAELRSLREKIEAIPPSGSTEDPGALLQPAMPDTVGRDPERYRAIMSEVENGLRQATGLATAPSQAPGWVGLPCADEEMTVWLLRAVVVENVMVRREGNVLFLPVDPAYGPGEVRRLVGVVGRAVRFWAVRRAQMPLTEATSQTSAPPPRPG
jgi:hypothetical protein